MRTAQQEWVRRRAEAVRKRYTAFQCLHEHGHGESLVDDSTAVQIFCPFHGNFNTPAARYYPSSGTRGDYVHCWRCHESWDAVNLFLKFKGLTFMEALRDLERRFSIRIDQRPDDSPGVAEPVDRSSSKFVSEAWSDVPRVLTMLEAKLVRLRTKASLHDYVRFCRVLDAVTYDLDLNKGEQTTSMVEALGRLRTSMDSAVDVSGVQDAPG